LPKQEQAMAQSYDHSAIFQPSIRLVFVEKLDDLQKKYKIFGSFRKNCVICAA
jgi:hypothetical protein